MLYLLRTRRLWDGTVLWMDGLFAVGEYQESLWHSVKSRCSSQCWVAELVKKILNVSWDMWAHHSGILHISAQAKQVILEKKINDQICSIYKTGSHALPCDALAFIHKPREQLLQLPLLTKQQWLELVKVAMA